VFAGTWRDFPLRHVESVGINWLVVWSHKNGLLFLIALGTRRVTRLLGKLKEMRVLDVIFSQNRMLMHVIVKLWWQFFAIFLAIASQPRMFTLFLFSIALGFAHSSDVAFIVTQKRVIYTVSGFAKCRKRHGAYQFPFQFRGNHGSITAFSIRKNLMYFGTSSRSVHRINMSSSPWTASEIKQFKFTVGRLQSMPLNALLGIDVRGEGDWSPVPAQFKHAVLCCALGFLSKVRGERMLHVIRLINILQAAAPISAKQNLLMLGQDQLQTQLASEPPIAETCLRFGILLTLTVLRTRGFPDEAHEQLATFRDLLLQANERSGQAVQYSILPWDFETAGRLIIDTPVVDPRFQMNVMKSVAIGPYKDHQNLDRVISHMVPVGCYDEAVNFSLLTDWWETAFGNLLRLNRELEVALVCRAQKGGNIRKKKLTTQIAARLCDSGFMRCAVVLFAGWNFEHSFGPIR
jgi:hypothetical protein